MKAFLLHPGKSFLISLVTCCAMVAAVQNTATAQSIDFANLTACDIKVTALVDVIGNNCASPTSAGSQLCPTGVTTNFTFTVPSGYEFCHYMMTAVPNTGGPYYQTIGGDPCAWNFSDVDLCDDMQLVSGKGNCSSARFTQ